MTMILDEREVVAGAWAAAEAVALTEYASPTRHGRHVHVRTQLVPSQPPRHAVIRQEVGTARIRDPAPQPQPWHLHPPDPLHPHPHLRAPRVVHLVGGQPQLAGGGAQRQHLLVAARDLGAGVRTRVGLGWRGVQDLSAAGCAGAGVEWGGCR